MNYQEAIRDIRDNGRGGLDEVIEAIAWGLVGGDTDKLTDTETLKAHRVYETLTAAGYRVVRL